MQNISQASGTRISWSKNLSILLTGMMALLMLVNFLRTVMNPEGFANYMGLPIQHPQDMAWVQVYGLRALFIGLVVAFSLYRKDIRALRVMVLIGVPLALGDAWLVYTAGGSTVWRHLMIASFLLLTSLPLWYWEKSKLSKEFIQS